MEPFLMKCAKVGVVTIAVGIVAVVIFAGAVLAGANAAGGVAVVVGLPLFVLVIGGICHHDPTAPAGRPIRTRPQPPEAPQEAA